MTINFTWKKILIFSIIFIVLLFVSFFIGRTLKIKSLKDSQIKLEQDLEIAISKISELEKRNNELLELNDTQKKLVEELKNENEKMKNDINSIKEIKKNTKQKLNKVSTDIDNTSNMIKTLKENQAIFRIYIENVSKITEE